MIVIVFPCLCPLFKPMTQFTDFHELWYELYASMLLQSHNFWFRKLGSNSMADEQIYEVGERY
jgi:hypothetical protein